MLSKIKGLFETAEAKGAGRIENIMGMVDRTMEEIDLSEKEMAEEQEQDRQEINKLGSNMAERSSKMIRAAKIKNNLQKLFK